jgi:hypothetical protein
MGCVYVCMGIGLKGSFIRPPTIELGQSRQDRYTSAVARRRRPNKPCIFCVSTDNPSKEDVIARWIRRSLQIHGDVHEYTGTVHIGKLETLAVKLPEVCEGCNSGWMSRLEERVIPVLKPLLLGTPRGRMYALDPSYQATLATWAVKTSLLLTKRKYRGAENGWIPEDNLKWLYEHRDSDVPPPGACVWIGSLNAEGRLPASAQAACITENGNVPVAHCGTFSVGYVLFQVFCCERGNSVLSPENEEWLAPKELYRNSLLQIWPASASFRWPPESVFKIDALPVVAGRLGEGLPSAHEAV